ncbi:RDD family protein [Globicatella sulfidifaciens]|uniref:RDD family protein n=1 Tax=Globicatella sulfidifaciens TaxID=136093 RepID=UPI0028917BAD|nr:RDD family protein [Globicatella sulfidifaciens]MDT2767733.1 RDD family protein [Globicatella sulfidifaciens]
MTKLDKSTLEDEWVNQVEQLSENTAGDAITNNESQATSDEELVDTVNESLTHDAEDDAVLAREDYEDVKVLHDNVTPELSSVNENVSEQELPVNETMLTPKDNSLNQEPSTNETQSTSKDDASKEADLLTANETNQQTAATSTEEEYDWSTGKDSTNNYQAIEKAAWEADRKHKIDKGSPYEFHYIASAHRRVVAFLIDSLVITGLINLFFSMWSFTSLINFGISTAIYCLYFAGLTLIFKGQTLGKMIMGLRTVRLDGYNLKLSDIFFREIVSRIIQRPYPFLYLISFFTSEKKQIGDWVANTCVIVDFE